MIQCHVKPMPEYSSHVIGRFQFLRAPREASDTRPSGKVHEALNPAGLIIVGGDRKVVVDPKATVDSDAGGDGPVIITQKSYDMLMEAHGKRILLEPIGDSKESARLEEMAKKLADARIKALEDENRKLSDVAAAEKKTLEDQLAEARATIAEYESVSTSGKRR